MKTIWPILVAAALVWIVARNRRAKPTRAAGDTGGIDQWDRLLFDLQGDETAPAASDPTMYPAVWGPTPIPGQETRPAWETTSNLQLAALNPLTVEANKATA